MTLMLNLPAGLEKQLVEEAAMQGYSASDYAQLVVERHLRRPVKRDTLEEAGSHDDTLAIMAADPEIQRELAAINREFSVADCDGLENLS